MKMICEEGWGRGALRRWMPIGMVESRCSSTGRGLVSWDR